MLSTLKNNRIKINKELDTIEKRASMSPALLALNRAILPEIGKYLSGTFIDLGCGEAPYRHVITPLVEEYITMDFDSRGPELDYTCDIQDMSPIPSNLVNSAGCFDVLEHVPDTAKACREMYRIIRPGGYLIVTTPFLARLHEIPHDYFRFTEYGLRSVFEKHGFTTIIVMPFGGPMSFVGHQLSTLLLCATWHIPVLKWVVFTLNKWIITKPCYHLDRVVKGPELAPTGYLSVFVKNNNGE
jgi:predicted SAM-dependent methyltransferase